ncbi:MAG: murein transglycosylase domain-containing protein [Pseudomonadota bacterium]|nr:murein transglycosylase domain-containing protein [Pseudomonadota bacterium]
MAIQDLIIRTRIIWIAAVLWYSPCSLSEEDSFETLDALLEAQFQYTDETLEADYQALDAALKKAYKRFKNEIEDVWGEGEVVLPEKSTWVDYSPNRKLRRRFDFEKGFVQIERIFKEDSELDNVTREIQLAVQAAAADTGADLSRKDTLWQYASQDLQNRAVTIENTVDTSQRPVMADLLDIPESAAVLTVLKKTTKPMQQSLGLSPQQENPAVQTSSDTDKQANRPEMTATVIAMANEQKKIMVTIPLRQNYLSSAAAAYQPKVLIEAARQSLPPSLLYAIMETESHFNPRARSHIPAFGLMQLVPASGGVDAYQHLYGEKLVLGPDYFYNADQNVELGAAYLNLLDTRYLKSISNSLSRTYCVIAAYNTGPGNVARAFVDSKSVLVASREINKLTPEVVFEQLVQRLPYKETRHYLQKVISAQKKYQEMDQLVRL